jgi:hypothetical protein
MSEPSDSDPSDNVGTASKAERIEIAGEVVRLLRDGSQGGMVVDREVALGALLQAVRRWRRS